jgi:glyoxylase-like metal-dependent hydrolase (beta-lactamase superfamily II)
MKGNIGMTGTLGFDYKLLRESIDLLREPGAPRAYVFLPGHDDHFKLVYTAA